MMQQRDRQLLWRAFLYLRPYRGMVVGVYLAMLVINAINLALPQILRLGIDRGIYGGNMSWLGWATAALLGLNIIKGLFIYYQGMWTEISSQAVAYDVRNELLSKLASLPFSFHDQSEAGQILARAMQDVERIRFLTGRAILRIVEGSTLILFTAGILLWMNSTLALLVILIIPFLVHRAYVFGKLYRPLSYDIQDQLGVLTNQLEQNLRGAQIVKAFAQEEAETERFIKENEHYFDFSAQAARVSAFNAPLLDMIANFGTVFILFFGGWLVIQQSLSLGELVAFTTYLGMLVRPIRLMGRIIPILAIAASAAQRLFEILAAPAEVSDRPDATPLPRVQGHVRFENVSFAYQKGAVVLHDIDFEARPGQIVALMGATGSGKTTLINLISRFYEPTEGRVTIDGYDTRYVTLHSLRSQIGIVMQDTILFAATVHENITFGRPDATDEEVVQAARDAQAHEFISAMPQGYDTRIGERGVTLSGGQKQRLAIARALITDPRILILDDATASVDNRTERLIQAALSRLMEGRTTFVIAHRLSTVQRADLILLLDKGRIVARGTHASLLASSPRYRQIFELQIQDHEREQLIQDAIAAEESRREL